MPHTSSRAMTWPSGQTLLLIAALSGSCLLVGYLLVFDRAPAAAPAAAGSGSRLSLADIPFNGSRAFDYLSELCALGPRVSNSRGMQAQQELLAAHFQKLGGKVRWQKFRIRHP